MLLYKKTGEVTMEMAYQTERLELKILDDTASAKVLQFYQDNREIIEKYETDRPPQFYTDQFQKMLLQGEYNLAVKQKSLRFWVQEQGQPDRIVGTVSFHNIKYGFYQCCELGYKFDQRFWGRGYATESISKGIQVIFGELKLHRIEACVLPGNTASQKLLLKLGFEFEGIKKQSVKLHGRWRDHELYALLSEEEPIHSDSGTSSQILRC
ncbi:N-acetyltransferase [Petralouisia muris]|uniref:N-acetyltransferase n=1 Tax=Petralouisia muris TaxID=3032872 RepID=A0AC61RWB7_9FIRM|nr:N-acetyltransferase [Petralouisia muris]